MIKTNSSHTTKQHGHATFHRSGHAPYVSRGGDPFFGLTALPAGTIDPSERRRQGLPFSARRLVLIGAVGHAGHNSKVMNHGGQQWLHYQRYHGRAARRARHPLDNWSRTSMNRITTYLRQHRALGRQHHVFFPFDQPASRPAPYPFQQWARRIGFSPSPLGLFIHPSFGLWVGFRAAIALPHHNPNLAKKLFGRHQALYRGRHAAPNHDGRHAAPNHDGRHAAPHHNPCANCTTKPCCSTCPAGAVTTNGFRVAACQDYLLQHPDSDCMLHGCVARRACPVGTGHRYPPAQQRFTMRSLAAGYRAYQASMSSIS